MKIPSKRFKLEQVLSFEEINSKDNIVVKEIPYTMSSEIGPDNHPAVTAEWIIDHSNREAQISVADPSSSAYSQ